MIIATYKNSRKGLTISVVIGQILNKNNKIGFVVYVYNEITDEWRFKNEYVKKNHKEI